MATGLKNLKIYKMAEELELKVHELTKIYPKDEKYRTVDQLRRSSASVSNNIAEAYNKSSIKEKLRIIRDIAKSEAEETKRNLMRSAKKGYCEKISIELANEYTNLIKAISGYIRFLKTYQLSN
uniref:S23 ribosomal protein n=2 Tax=Candidatus Giovannoniibacteriota TaxID=1752738 RepID=A0A0G0ZGZ9_9BACT|nr:MAG: S23 ribosomal protein [Candidatus Giovannonibacteria bacterium GW2011_GWF2_42_19]